MPAMHTTAVSLAPAAAAGPSAAAHAILAQQIALAPDGTAPEWIQLLPAGTVQPMDGRPAWTVTDAAALIRGSLATAAGGMLTIDYDHAMDLAAPRGERAPAAGWITALESRADGIWGRVDWTGPGSAAVAAREYRFFSPSFHFDPDTRRVTRILGGALVNRPALPQLPALTHTTHGEPMDEFLKALRKALGLPDSADQGAVLAAVQQARSQSSPLAATLAAAAGLDATATAEQIAGKVKAAVTGLATVATAAGLPAASDAAAVATAVATLKANATAATLLETQLATLSAQVKALEADKLAAKVDAAIQAGKFTPAQRADMLALAAANPELFDRITASAPALLKPGTDTPAGGKPPAAGELTAEQKAVCVAMGLSEDDYKKTLGLGATGTGG